MPKSSYRVVSFEGGDQVGKADAVLNLRKYLIEKSVPVTYSSFPIYSTPIGTTIRMFLKNGFDSVNIDAQERLGIKMSLYALNRLEFLNVLLSSPEYLRTLIILDRSSFSNAVTIAYSLCSELDKKEVDPSELVDLALGLDSFMIKKLGLEKCVLELVSKCKNWGNIRSENRDLYEHRDVQVLSNEIYKIYAKKIGRGWKQVVTKDENGWREREDILKEVSSNILEINKGVLKDSNMENRVVGVKETIEVMYPGCSVEKGDLKIYEKSLFENDKDTMYEYACKLGLSIANSCKAVEFKDREVKGAFKEIVEKYPGIFDVLLECMGENYTKRLQEGLR